MIELEVFLAWRLIEFGFLLGLVWPLFRTIKQPRAALYFPILAGQQCDWSAHENPGTPSCNLLLTDRVGK